MWGFGKSKADVWSAISELSKRHNEQLESRILELIGVRSTLKSGLPPSSLPLSALESGVTSDLAATYLVVWDSALGRAPFLASEILANFVSIPCSSQGPLQRLDGSLSLLETLFASSRRSTALKRLIVVTGASFTSLDLDRLFTALLQPLSDASPSYFDTIESIDLFVGENPSRMPTEARERVKRKIAPVTHTQLANIELHPLSAIYYPIANNIFQLHCDPAALNVGISNSILVSTSSPSTPLVRPSGFENRANMNIEYDSLSRDAKEKFEALVKTFSSFGLELGVRLEAWSLGPSAQLVAQQLAQSTIGSDTNAGGEKVSVIFADRNLDLLSPLSCGFKSLLDKHLFVQNYQSASTNTQSSSSNPLGDDIFMSGNDLMQILFKPPKDAMSTLLRKLSELAAEEGLEIDFSTGAQNALSQFYTTLNSTATGRNLLYSHRKLLLLLQLAASLQEEATYGPQFSVLLSTFKHILSSPHESPLHYILDYIEASSQISLEIVLRAVIALFMLSTFIKPSTKEAPSKKEVGKDHAQKDEEARTLDKIENALSIRLFSENDSMMEPMPSWLKDKSSQESVKHCLTELIAYLRSESSIEFEDFFTVQESSTEPCLLAQIVSRVFDSANPDLRDIKQASMSLGGLLKSGLSIVSLRHQPRPNDRHTVILFVLGGLTFQEARETLDMFSKTTAGQQKKNHLLLASNNFPTTLELADMYCM